MTTMYNSIYNEFFEKVRGRHKIILTNSINPHHVEYVGTTKTYFSDNGFSNVKEIHDIIQNFQKTQKIQSIDYVWSALNDDSTPAYMLKFC